MSSGNTQSFLPRQCLQWTEADRREELAMRGIFRLSCGHSLRLRFFRDTTGPPAEVVCGSDLAEIDPIRSAFPSAIPTIRGKTPCLALRTPDSRSQELCGFA
jgi:hypothetical protein